MPALRDVRLGEMSCPVCIGVRVHVWVCACVDVCTTVVSLACDLLHDGGKTTSEQSEPKLSFVRGGCTRGRPQRRDTCHAGNITQELVEYCFVCPHQCCIECCESMQRVVGLAVMLAVRLSGRCVLARATPLPHKCAEGKGMGGSRWMWIDEENAVLSLSERCVVGRWCKRKSCQSIGSKAFLLWRGLPSTSLIDELNCLTVCDKQRRCLAC